MKTIKFNELAQLPANATVVVPAVTGYHLARTVETTALRNLVEPYPMLGNDAFTEAYILTETGNLYRIAQEEDRIWAISSIRDNKRGWGPYHFPGPEIRRAVLRVGHAFFYGEGKTTRLVTIFLVNASRCYLGKHNHELACDIRREFERIRNGS